jgi:hypothetical protein
LDAIFSDNVSIRQHWWEIGSTFFPVTATQFARQQIFSAEEMPLCLGVSSCAAC